MNDARDMAIASNGKSRRRLARAASSAAMSILVFQASAHAQTPTPDPGAWRPVSYADLQRPSDATATYADIWRDAIDENNRSYVAHGDKRFVGANAPVTEAHFVIWSPKKSVVLSVLDSAVGCATHLVDPSAHVRVKLCPMRIVLYEGVQVRTMDGGKACFLELEPPQTRATVDPASSVAYVAYDVGAKTLKTGMIVNHRPVDGCATKIPLPSP